MKPNCTVCIRLLKIRAKKEYAQVVLNAPNAIKKFKSTALCKTAFIQNACINRNISVLFCQKKMKQNKKMDDILIR